LATTDVMLASTVQFSRYGWSRPSSPLRACRPVLAEGAIKRPFPQDPTACSARPPPRTRVPCCRSSCTSEARQDARTE
jgi:hypothetical protein